MEVRERILKAAAGVFAELGFRGATTRRIAQEAGVNEITIFRHFGSKTRLLHEAVTTDTHRIPPAVLPADPRHPRRELLGWARHYHQTFVANRSLIRTCMAEFEEHPNMITRDDPAAVATRHLREYLQRLKSRRLATAAFDPHAAATMLLGVLFADAMGRDVFPELYDNDPQKAIAQYVDLLLRAIGADRPQTEEVPR